MTLTFGSFRLDLGARRLLRGAKPVHMSPKAFALLALLVERAPEAVSKQEIHQYLWPRTFVSDINLAVLIREIRSALGDSASKSTFVRTVHRFGYAFTANVARDHASGGTASGCSIEWARGTRRAGLSLGDNVVGRDPAASVYVEAIGVSRRHAMISVSGNRVVLQDLGSKNGTYVDGERVTMPTPLADACEILLGAEPLIFRRCTVAKPTETVPSLPGVNRIGSQAS